MRHAIRSRARAVACALALAAPLWAPACTAPGGADAGDWPQYRGPARDGLVTAPGFTPHWTEAGPTVAWRRPLGSAFSQFVVRGDAAYTGTSDETREYLVRLNAASGEEVWRVDLGEAFGDTFGRGPRSTPTLDGDVVYMLGGRGKLIAAKAEDGTVLWSVDLTEKFGAELPRFGYSGSPLVVDGLLVLEVGAKDGVSLAALDKQTGELAWSALEGGAGYGSPIAFEFGGVRQIVVARKAVSAVDLAGKPLWSHELEEGAIAMPVYAGEGRIFASASGDTGCTMLQLVQSETGFEVEVLWSNREMRNHFNSSIVLDGHIYGFDNATLKCLSATTGEVLWAKRGLGKGSVAAVGAHLMVLGDKGQLLLVRATPVYEELGSVQAIEGKSWTAPSFAGGRLFVRNLDESACFDLRG